MCNPVTLILFRVLSLYNTSTYKTDSLAKSKQTKKQAINKEKVTKNKIVILYGYECWWVVLNTLL